MSTMEHQFVMWMPKELYSGLRAQAKREGCSMAEVVRSYIAEDAARQGLGTKPKKRVVIRRKK